MKITILIANDELEAKTELVMTEEFKEASREDQAKHLSRKIGESLKGYYDGVELLAGAKNEIQTKENC